MVTGDEGVGNFRNSNSLLSEKRQTAGKHEAVGIPEPCGGHKIHENGFTPHGPRSWAAWDARSHFQRRLRPGMPFQLLGPY